MIFYPAIDLKGGQCVRLLRGEMASATVFNDDPAAQAEAFAALGFSWLHIVDLDGAVEGAARNAPAVAAILKRVTLPVQLGGGIRDRAAIEYWLEAGVRRVILGTVAVRDPDLVRTAARAHPGRIVVGIDARAGWVAIEGWAEATEVAACDLALRMQDAGAAAIIYTDIARDGTGSGVNIAETAAIAEAVSIPVIASGGIGSLNDLRTLQKQGHRNIAGVIIGRALYDGRVDARAALMLAKGEE
ncbi:MAG: 1-(5-phosphoribosyl)-5-[(5-phosphoribosylamino)methylideneamino]imidazole-4-carboxamide isomerase [Micropepsaceae bacterium]